MNAIASTAPARDTSALTVAPAATVEAAFPIIGVGTSAGGLDALERFFSKVPATCGYAFVVVQHLDPTQKALLVELLQRCTPLPVVEITDGLTVERDHIYVIPPNCDISIDHGMLQLLDPQVRRGLRLPIDGFLRRLAEDREALSIGVILSGMGSDGTSGARVIKEHAGAVFVQSPDTAQFSSMPQSAVDAGLADVIAPANELYGAIVRYLSVAPRLVEGSARPADEVSTDVARVVSLLRSQTRHDFSHYKSSTVTRRVQRRMGVHHLPTVAAYEAYLRANPAEGELLFKELLIGVTNFFRDTAVWTRLVTDVLPALIRRRTTGEVFRAWVAGCSTGEEAYSFAIAFVEALESITPTPEITLQLFATDLDKDAIEKSRVGFFPLGIAADVSDARLQRFFVKEERGYRIAKRIREMIVFAPQNMVADPPFTRLDVLSCRTVLIYLTAKLQRALLPIFHHSLIADGVLLLGNAESIGSATDLFESIDGKLRLFRKIDHEGPKGPGVLAALVGVTTAAPAPAMRVPPVLASELQGLTEQLLFRRYSPPAVLVGEQGDILYVSGRTGKYLEPAAGKANWNVFAMAREGLNHALTEGVRRALRTMAPVTVSDITMGTGEHAAMVQIDIQPLATPESLRGCALVIFHDVAASVVPGSQGKPSSIDDDVESQTIHARDTAQLRDELFQSRSDSQRLHEELRSTSEEWQSTNEELQSTNEELTTSKEEVQSMNEELQTVNHELQAKLDDLNSASSDMRNLLDSTSIATLFLDKSLLVRRFTVSTAGIFRLKTGDVGRPITDITSMLVFPDMTTVADTVMRTLVSVERDIATTDGRWFAIRILPYRTHDDRADGVVLTFSDITRAKALENELRETRAALEVRLVEQSVTPPSRDVRDVRDEAHQ